MTAANDTTPPQGAPDLADYWRTRWQRECAPLAEPTDAAIRSAMAGVEWLPMHDEAEAFDLIREMLKRFAPATPSAPPQGATLRFDGIDHTLPQVLADECKRLADEYANARVLDEKVTWECKGASAEEQAERQMWAAQKALDAALVRLASLASAPPVPPLDATSDAPDALGASASPTALSAPALRASAPIAGAAEPYTIDDFFAAAAFAVKVLETRAAEHLDELKCRGCGKGMSEHDALLHCPTPDWKEAYLNMRDWAGQNGLDTRAFIGPIPARNTARGIVSGEAGETPQGARPEGQEPGPKDAPSKDPSPPAVPAGEPTGDDFRHCQPPMRHIPGVRVEVLRRAALASKAVPAGEQEPAAWLRSDDPRDAISDAKKRDMMEVNGAPGKKLAATYSVPCFATPVPSPADDLADWCTHITFVQNAAGDDGESWADQFRSVYSPEKWLGVHRAACAFLGGKIRERSAVPSPVMAWPKDAAEIREFIGSNFNSLRYARVGDQEPDEMDTYSLSAHDLLSAFDQWQDAIPSPEPEGEG
jgi:hypothetical protein